MCISSARSTIGNIPCSTCIGFVFALPLQWTSWLIMKVKEKSKALLSAVNTAGMQNWRKVYGAQRQDLTWPEPLSKHSIAFNITWDASWATTKNPPSLIWKWFLGLTIGAWHGMAWWTNERRKNWLVLGSSARTVENNDGGEGRRATRSKFNVLTSQIDVISIIER